MTLALCGLMIVAVASFGGIGYAAGSKPAKQQLERIGAVRAVHAEADGPVHAEGDEGEGRGEGRGDGGGSEGGRPGAQLRRSCRSPVSRCGSRWRSACC